MSNTIAAGERDTQAYDMGRAQRCANILVDLFNRQGYEVELMDGYKPGHLYLWCVSQEVSKGMPKSELSVWIAPYGDQHGFSSLSEYKHNDLGLEILDRNLYGEEEADVAYECNITLDGLSTKKFINQFFLDMWED